MSDPVRAATATDVPDGGCLAVEIDGLEVVLVRQGEEVFALRDECTHGSVPLSEGDVEGGTIECFLHGSRFDIRSGKPLNFPATTPVATYPTTIEGEDIFVALPEEN